MPLLSDFYFRSWLKILHFLTTYLSKSYTFPKFQYIQSYTFPRFCWLQNYTFPRIRTQALLMYPVSHCIIM